MLPPKFRYELEAYYLRINRTCWAKTIVVEDDDEVLEAGIADWKSRLGKLPIVGFDFRPDMKILDVDDDTGLLMLFVEHCCLIVHLGVLGKKCSLFDLWELLDDSSICFVGMDMNTKIEQLRKSWINKLPICELSERILVTGCDIKDFIGRVFQKQDSELTSYYDEKRLLKLTYEMVVDNHYISESSLYAMDV